MLVNTPEIQLHGKDTQSDPVYSVHVQPPNSAFKNSKNSVRIATGGISEVRIWLVYPTEHGSTAGPTVEFRASLERHDDAINCVRFSPDGWMLATADVGGIVCLWKFTGDNYRTAKDVKADQLGVENLEQWRSQNSFHRHTSEVTDISWSVDGKYLSTASLDNCAVVWDVEKATVWRKFEDAKGFLLGTCWDPQSRYMVTLSADKALRFYSPYDQSADGTKMKHKFWKITTGLAASEPMFIGEDNCMARRRLDFSPDGNLLVAPAGSTKSIGNGNSKNQIACSYVFNMDNKQIGNPVAILPAMGATSLVRFCPVRFTHRPSSTSPRRQNFFSESDTVPMEVEGENVGVACVEGENVGAACEAKRKNPFLLQDGLPYRMIFAVATAKQICFYDTDMELPFAMIDQIHASDLSDLAWSRDGRMLVVSSLDGFCSFVEFSAGELGVVYVPPPQSPTPAALQTISSTSPTNV